MKTNIDDWLNMVYGDGLDRVWPLTAAIPPKTPADCLAHCRASMNGLDYDLALAMIALLVSDQRCAAAIEAIEEIHQRHMASLNAIASGPEELRK